MEKIFNEQNEGLTEHKTRRRPRILPGPLAGSTEGPSLSPCCPWPSGAGARRGFPEAVSVTYPYQFSVQHLASQSWLEK